MYFSRLSIALLSLASGSCEPTGSHAVEAPAADPIEASIENERSNPFFMVWDTPYGIPPFSEIRDEDYLPAFEAGMAERRADFDRIRNKQQPPDFVNTVLTLENAGRLLSRVRSLFNNAVNTRDSEYLLQREMNNGK